MHVQNSNIDDPALKIRLASDFTSQQIYSIELLEYLYKNDLIICDKMSEVTKLIYVSEVEISGFFASADYTIGDIVVGCRKLEFYADLERQLWEIGNPSWVRTSHRMYDGARGAVPPAMYGRSGAFLLGEAYSGSEFTAFQIKDECRFYARIMDWKAFRDGFAFPETRLNYSL